MSPPIESAKNASPARQKIATNQGSTRTRTHIRPHTGRRRHSHAADRSRIASVTIVSPTNIRISGPLSRWRVRGILAPLPRQIHPRHRPHRGDDGQQQHRIGFGEPRFGAEQHRTAQDKGGQYGPAPRHECERGPVGQQHRPDRTDQGRHAVEPDANLGPRQAQRRGGFDHGCLQPVDADRLLVAHIVLEPDVDEIPALDHLLGRLREPRLVAVDRRNVEKSRQKQ